MDNYCLLKIRINFEDQDKVEEYLKIVTEYICSTGVPFTEYTAGCHYKCERQHFHYHLILDININKVPKELKNPSYHFKKKYIVKKELKDFPTYSIKVEPLQVDSLQPSEETARNRFLRYPLKEGKPIPNYCSYSTDTLDGMCTTAMEEFRFAEEQKLKTENSDKLKVSKWNEIRDYLDSLNIEDPYEIWMAIARKMKDDSIPPTFKTIDTNTERYIILRGNMTRLANIAMKRTKQFETIIEKLNY